MNGISGNVDVNVAVSLDAILPKTDVPKSKPSEVYVRISKNGKAIRDTRHFIEMVEVLKEKWDDLKTNEDEIVIKLRGF